MYLFRENHVIKIFLKKIKLSRNLRSIAFKMMYNISMLRHQFSNERWRGEGVNHLPLLFCKSVHMIIVLTFLGLRFDHKFYSAKVVCLSATTGNIGGQKDKEYSTIDTVGISNITK